MIFIFIFELILKFISILQLFFSTFIRLRWIFDITRLSSQLGRIFFILTASVLIFLFLKTMINSCTRSVTPRTARIEIMPSYCIIIVCFLLSGFFFFLFRFLTSAKLMIFFGSSTLLDSPITHFFDTQAFSEAIYFKFPSLSEFDLFPLLCLVLISSSSPCKVLTILDEFVRFDLISRK